MDEAELLAQAAALVPVYVDGFGAFRKSNGVFRCVGFVLDSGAQLNLIISLAGAMTANTESHRVLAEPPKPMEIKRAWNGTGLAH